MKRLHSTPQPPRPACIELCAGAGGQALGLERAGFGHTALIELDPDAVQTLGANRPLWNVIQTDVRELSSFTLRSLALPIALLAAGVPCPPFSLAGKQLGAADERDLFPAVLRLVTDVQPQAVMIENVKGILQARFDSYRAGVLRALEAVGYHTSWRLIRACDFGVPQLRPRAVLVAMRPEAFARFTWPEPTTSPETAPTVGNTLYKSMASRGWELAGTWAHGAMRIAPTLCGGSRKHGGADLGPSRARRAWAELGVNGSSVADEPPAPGAPLPVRLTVRQMALLQGFPEEWCFAGRKTSAYRQVGNAFPPPVAEAVGVSIAKALAQTDAATGDFIPQAECTATTLPGSAL
ncbi:DNA (cytosine-5-)-methyltransferase [Streptomyces sp. SID3915]|uniref:DNA cytosine methyltransferase n=1 Tax=Streptomyces sp. SID3915 TaxID=2690263 RepID=UPI00136DF335|nr:DNA (cytosine-5-)-methyltransferase [Streptomyces sp. SID3915]MYX76265.1 DNA (cytosine-5-)-methyltransferase [Streptomyces sp. SID3915]